MRAWCGQPGLARLGQGGRTSPSRWRIGSVWSSVTEAAELPQVGLRLAVLELDAHVEDRGARGGDQQRLAQVDLLHQLGRNRERQDQEAQKLEKRGQSGIARPKSSFALWRGRS